MKAGIVGLFIGFLVLVLTIVALNTNAITFSTADEVEQRTYEAKTAQLANSNVGFKTFNSQDEVEIALFLDQLIKEEREYLVVSTSPGYVSYVTIYYYKDTSE